jgi:ligand-binding sensor domain-containing protein
MIRTFAERANGELLLTTFHGRIFEVSGDQWRPLPAPPGVSRGYFGQVDQAGQWWVVQHRFVGRWDGKHWRETIVVADRPGLHSESVGGAAARDGGMWVLLGQELCKYRGETEVARFQLRENPCAIWSLTEDSRGHVWICTHDKGLCEISPTGEMKRWTAPDAIPHQSTRFVFEDREHNLWVGTSGGGLNRLKPKPFQSFGAESGLSKPMVTSVCTEPSGQLLIGTYGGGVFRLGPSGLRRVIWSEPLRGRPDNVQSVLVDRAGRIWVGAYEDGLWIMEQGTNRRVPSRGRIRALPPIVSGLERDVLRAFTPLHRSKARRTLVSPMPAGC